MIGFIVEGKSDVEKLEMVLKERCVYYVVLNGINFKENQIKQIKKAVNICEKVYILTDPDDAGNKVAKLISKTFPEINRIEVDPNQAKVLKKRGYKYGVEYCSNNYLKSLLSPHLRKTSLS
ncbi:toprim domain-containing protein [Bacillus mexicanus]|uniref:toprim domain-containing protein n=1 Tax=Bacillus mexicanus TaxID=2834415 RepID=UPI003D25BEED